jgi:hypothetical protein
MKKMYGLLVAGVLFSIHSFSQTYQPLEDQRVGTTNNVTFNAASITTALESRGTIFHRRELSVLNKAGDNWLVWANRNAAGGEVTMDLNYISSLNGYIPLHAGNYNSYAPTLTGTGASGNWNINAASATNTTYWGNLGADFANGPGGSNLAWIAAADGTAGTVRPYFAPAIRTWLGIPSGGETLQSVTDRDNVTSNVLQVTGIGHGKTNTLGLELDYNGYGDNRGRVFSYDRVNNIYKGLRLEGSDLIINAASGGNVGIGTIAPATTFHVGDNSSVVYSTAIAGHGGTDIVAIGNRSGIASINGYANDFSAVKNLALNPDGGNVGIGTTNPTQKLSVDGTVLARKVKVSQTPSDWPDYVFDSSYQLAPLHAVEKYIQQNKHLPELPSAAEVKNNGIDLGDNQAVLLKKIEELTLYIIEQDKRIKKLEEERK